MTDIYIQCTDINLEEFGMYAKENAVSLKEIMKERGEYKTEERWKDYKVVVLLLDDTICFVLNDIDRHPGKNPYKK